MRKKRVYIAGPYSTGDAVLNVRAACIAADDCLKRGFTPFVPHLTHLWHMISPKEYETWMDIDAEFLRVCDAVYRIPGASAGADREVEMARHLGIPVYFAVADILN